MKYIHILIFFFVSFIVNGQDLFSYERKIEDIESYNFQEIEFHNTNENIKLSGTLITPKSNFEKVVVIVPGSGKDTRHSHFLLAEEFLKNGIAVYRYQNI